MSDMRTRDGTPERLPSRPTVAGVAGGVGTSTVATAIGAFDRGLFTGRGVDVLVCRATGDSLIRAGRAAQLCIDESGHPPVLAVTAIGGSGPSRPVTARLRLVEPHACAVVVLPYVKRWRELAAPLDDVRGLLAVTPAELPRPLRSYAAALRELRSALHLPPLAPATRPPVRRPATVPTRGRTTPSCTP